MIYKCWSIFSSGKYLFTEWNHFFSQRRRNIFIYYSIQKILWIMTVHHHESLKHQMGHVFLTVLVLISSFWEYLPISLYLYWFMFFNMTMWWYRFSLLWFRTQVLINVGLTSRLLYLDLAVWALAFLVLSQLYCARAYWIYHKVGEWEPQGEQWKNHHCRYHYLSLDD